MKKVKKYLFICSSQAVKSVLIIFLIFKYKHQLFRKISKSENLPAGDLLNLIAPAFYGQKKALQPRPESTQVLIHKIL